MNDLRGYSSPLRQRQTEDTRRRIVDAALEIIRQHPEESISHEEIARRSEIAVRTVYRHFPAKTDLLDAVWQESDRRLELAHFPETEQELLDSLETVYSKMDQDAALMRGLLHSNAGLEMRRRDNERRLTGIKKALQNASAHLSHDQRRFVTAVFMSLYNARTWKVMRDRAHLNEGETAQAIRWAMETLLQGLARTTKQSRPRAETLAAKPSRPKVHGRAPTARSNKTTAKR